MFKKIFCILILVFCLDASAASINVVAAENFYGKMTEQIGGQYVQVNSILTNPQQDPHLFTNSAQTAKSVADAQFIIYNGVGYDSWVENLLAVSKRKNQHIINVGELIGKKAGDNPHIWYDPQTMLVFANYLTAQLSQQDAVHADYYHQQLAAFIKDFQSLEKQIVEIRNKDQGTEVIATEPVFNYMADALNLKMNGQGFQISIMNDTEPSASDMKNFETKLKNRQVKVFIYNNQVNNPSTERMKTLAQKSHIPIVGVSETEPTGENYCSWMSKQLTDLAKALE